MPKGTMLYDVLVMLGTLIMILIIIYWASSYGAMMISDVLYASPRLLQDYSATALALGSLSSGDLYSSYEPKIPLSTELELTKNMIHARPAKRPPEAMRIILPRPYPVRYIKWQGIHVKAEKILFNETKHKKIFIQKADNELRIGVA
jgi:hypothetical protein